MALRDYFIEKAATGLGSSTDPDSWALKYINIGRTRSILEAFDDDASGFVTVDEVNRFTRSRPLGWRCASVSQVHAVSSVHPDHSLPHWIAYWAIGNLLRAFRFGGLTFF